MKKANIGLGILISALLTAPLIALFYLGYQLADLYFVPFDLFNWVTKLLPGPLVTFGIDLMIDTLRFLRIDVADAAKTAEQMMAALGFFAVGTIIGTIFVYVAMRRKVKPGLLEGLLAGALLGVPLVTVSVGAGDSAQSLVVNILWLAVMFGLWGVTLAWLTSRLLSFEDQVSPAEAAAAAQEVEVQHLNRRQFLIVLGAASATITVVGTGIAAAIARTEQQRRLAELADSMAHQSESPKGKQLPNQDDPVSPAPGTRPEYTPLKDHYKVFIEVEPTQVDGSTWMLPISGMVDNPLVFTEQDLRKNYTPRSQYVTLSCISGRVGTSLIGTTLWEGPSVKDVLADVQVQPGARYLKINSADGFYETIDLDLINTDERIMFCYNWDGNPLPSDHGYPLRIWIPDRYGMKQPKWITSVEVTDEYEEGYWVERGWDEVAQVKATSVIDTVAANAVFDNGGGQMVPIGGIAYSGDRGISKVEVRMDGGDWQEADLRSPLSETTWVIWRVDWPFEPGSHTFEVRCAEADGTPQIEQESKARPAGSTGIDALEADL